MMTRKSIDTVLFSVAADKLSQRERDWIKLMKPIDPPPAMVASAIPEHRHGIAKRLNFDYTIWTENKLSVSQPISLFLLFACAHLCSIGLRSGEYVGKYSTIYPASMMTC